MSGSIIVAAAAGTALLGTAAGFTAGAFRLFNRTVPRQDQLRVDISEMADMEKWEEYKKFIVPNREWLEQQPLEHVTITSYDGLKLHAEYFPAECETNKLAIVNHGYTGSGMRDSTSISVFFHKIGYDVLIVDHRAHGNSEGKYIGFGILDRFDCKGWINYVDTRFDKKRDIVLYGTSMGGSIVLMTAGFTDLSDSVKAVVADCAFTTPYDVFAHILKRDYHLPPFPIMNISNMLCKKKAGYGFRDYSTIEAMETTKLPILFFHGKEDTFVPTYMTEENYAACKSEKEIMLVDNAAHAASYYENPAAYENKIKNFLDKHVK